MRHAGRITAEARKLAGSMVRPGENTLEIDTAIRKYIRSQGANPSSLNYCGYPFSSCISVNDEVVHGFPSAERILKEGDIVDIDITVEYDGYQGDCCATFPVGKVSAENRRLIEVTTQAFWEGFRLARKGNRLSDVSHAVQICAESSGFSVVRDYIGHGIGKEMHEPPEVPNYGPPGHGVRLLPGMTICLEPMINAGTWKVRVLDNEWTAVTLDGKNSAHYENTILITDGDPEILTCLEDGTDGLDLWSGQ